MIYPGVLPSWLTILAALAQLLASPAFWFHLSVTGMEIGLSMVLGGALGTMVGLLLGANRWLGPPLERYVGWLASTPKVVFLPLVFILFGIGYGLVYREQLLSPKPESHEDMDLEPQVG